MVSEVIINLGQAHSLQQEKIEWHFLRKCVFFFTQTHQLLHVCAARKKPRRRVVSGTALTTSRKQSRHCIK